MNRRIELGCAWSGVPFVVLFFAGFLLLARWVPPVGPSLSATRLVARYQEHTNSFRLGLALAFIGSIFFLTFGVGIAHQTRRIKGAASLLFHLQIVSVAAAVIILILPIMIWWTAAFRLERSPELTQLLHDLGCIIFVVGFVPYVTWALGVGVSILSDSSQNPLFPRWSGYLSLLVAFIQIPPVVLVFFKTGPFAWNGVFSWWTIMFAFFAWIVAMIVVTIQAIDAPTTEVSLSDRGRAPVLSAQ